MRKTTKGHGLAGACLVAAMVVGIMLLLAGGLLLGYFSNKSEPIATGIVMLYAFVLLAVAIGVLVALVQRWKEVRGGEEDEARKY
ncbi:MAG: hypothetical protein ACOX7N_09090 [Lawsonibacter sp.]